MLEIESLHVSYGPVKALRGVSVRIDEGEVVTAIGANGAGKSTLLMTISGVLKPVSGEIRFMGERIDGLEPHRIVRRGLSQVPEGRRVFPLLTIDENLTAGSIVRSDAAGVSRDRDWVYSLFPRLKERIAQPAGTLSGGEQQMLAIGRGLMAKPKLLLLDEPSMGLAPKMVATIFAILGEISSAGTTIMLVEQNAFRALELASRGYVLEGGQMILSGRTADIAADPRMKEAYLGQAVSAGRPS
jgi:branched-chain amino acid transport system ATP-binding protein